MRPCLACLRPITELPPGVPAICIDCWPTLSIVERAQLLDMEQNRAVLRAILAQLQGNSETECLQHAADKIELHSKKQAATVAALRVDVIKFLEWVKERMESQGDEPWRG